MGTNCHPPYHSYTRRPTKGNPIFAGKFRDFDKIVADARAEGIAKAEKKKGRKLNAAELKELDENMKDAKTKMKTMRLIRSVSVLTANT